MLDLQTRVHFDEIELAVFIEKLNRPDAEIAELADSIADDLADFFALQIIEGRRRALFQHLLVTTLQRAVAFTQMRHIAMCIGNNLQFDVTRRAEIFFHVERIVAKSRFGFGARGRKRARHFLARIGNLHAATTAAGSRLDENGIARFFGDFIGFFVGRDRAVGAGYTRNAERTRRDFGLDFIAHQADVIARRSDERDAMRFQNIGKARVLRQEAVTGMHSVSAGDLAGGNDRRNVEIAFAGRRGPDANAFIGKAHVHGIGVGGGMHGDRLDAHFAAGAMDAQRDFATVCNEDFFKHGRWALFDDDEGFAEFDRMAVFNENFHHSACLRRGNMVHRLHRFDDEHSLTDTDLGSDSDERRSTRLSREICRANHRRRQRAGVGSVAHHGCGNRCRRRGRGLSRCGDGNIAANLPRNAQTHLLGFNFDFAEVGLFKESRELPDQVLVYA